MNSMLALIREEQDTALALAIVHCYKQKPALL